MVPHLTENASFGRLVLAARPQDIFGQWPLNEFSRSALDAIPFPLDSNVNRSSAMGPRPRAVCSVCITNDSNDGYLAAARSADRYGRGFEAQ